MEAQDLADSLLRRTDSVEVRIVERTKVLVRRDTVLAARTDSVQAEPVPAVCDSVVAVRDSLIDEWRDQATSWRSQFEEQRKNAAELRFAVSRLEKATKAVVEVYNAGERGSLFYRITHPELRPGFFAGICSNGKPCAGAGISLTF